MGMKCGMSAYRSARATPQYEETDFLLKGFSLEGNTVRYSTEISTKKDRRREQEYIPVESVEQKVLSEEATFSIRLLSDKVNWATRIVARDEDWKLEREGNQEYWVFRGRCETFTAHIIGPDKRGMQYNKMWKGITNIILDEK